MYEDLKGMNDINCKNCHGKGYYMTDDTHIKNEYIEIECDCEE